MVKNIPEALKKLPEKVKNLPKNFRPTKKNIIIASVAVIAVVGVSLGIGNAVKRKSAATDSEIKMSTVGRGNVEVLISGSGTVEPYERFEIISSVEGDILSAPFEIGDAVKKDDVLFKIDSSDAEIDLRKQENSLKSSELSNIETHKDLEKLSISAPCDGIISDMNLKVGEDIKNNTMVATVTNTSAMKVNLPFNESQKTNIFVGQTAEISSSAHMTTVYGKVVHIDSYPTPQTDGSVLYNATIEFANPGSFTDGIVVGGAVNGIVSPGSGVAEYLNKETVSAETEGTITSVRHSNGDYVKKGTVIATIENASITNSVIKSDISYQDAQLSLETKRNSLSDYTITSPIDGTVLSKEYKTGDTIGKSNSSISLMVVADISRLKFTLEIDELDVAKVKSGQEVQITCDAVAGETFIGEITNVSIEGSASNGVTTYTADVVINEPGSLRPSMNIDASVIVESAENVLILPASDVKTVGGMSYVFLKEDSASAKSAKNGENAQPNIQRGERPHEMPQEEIPNGAQSAEIPRRERSESAPSGMGGGRPEGATARMPSGNTESSKGGAGSSVQGERGMAMGRMPEAPEGFITQIVTTGIASDDYIEIRSGLVEGDIVYTQAVSASSNNMMMGRMPGGMGGGIPGGPGGGPRG